MDSDKSEAQTIGLLITVSPGGNRKIVIAKGVMAAVNLAKKVLGTNTYDKLVSITLPCGEEVSYDSLDALPIDDVPCRCGNATHWFIKWQEVSP